MKKTKGKRKRRIATVIIILLILIIVGGAAYYYFSQSSETNTSEDYEAQTQIYSSVKPSGEESDEVNLLADAQAINPQTVAWLNIPDTAIDFPVMQCEDNSYYLKHSFEGDYSVYGCPFLDYRNSSDFTDFNSIIYGHNYSNKYIFAPLLNFKNQTYFNEHPTGTLTLEREIKTISFIACAVVESDAFVYSVVHPAKSDRETYLEMLSDVAICKTDFEPSELTEENLVVLSTCTRDSNDSRTILVGYLE